MDRYDRTLVTEAELLARNWWAIALRGVAAIVFGVLAFMMPTITLAGLVMMFGAYALVDGILNVVAALRGHGGAHPWWSLLLAGLLGIGAGLVTFLMPRLTGLALTYVIAAWAIVIGVLEIAAAVTLREHIDHEWWLGLSGVLSIVFGALLIVGPIVAALVMVLWLGAFAVAYGMSLVVLAFRLRGWRAELPGDRLRRAA